MVTHKRPRRRTRRKGLALVAVLVFAVVILMLLTAMTKALTRDQRQVRGAQNRLQASWLAESAVQRTVSSLKESPDYEGESWDVPADKFGNEDGASVVIQVEQGDESSTSRTVLIEARFPSQSIQSVLVVREFVIELP